MDPTDLLCGVELPNFRSHEFPNFKKQMAEINQPYTAKNIFYQLVTRIHQFELSLDQEHEVGMRLVSFGQSIQFSVTKLSYMDPSIIWFQGMLSDGSGVELVQHINQISFLMMAVKRQNPEKPKAPIGFYQDQQSQENLKKNDSNSDSQQEVAVTTDPADSLIDSNSQ